MKKRSILSFVAALTFVGGAFVGLTSCGEEAAVIENNYAYGEVNSNAYGGSTTDVYSLNFYSDSTYELVKSTLTIGYGMNLGTTTLEVYGTYTVGTSEDGWTSYALSTADRIVLNSYSDMGGFALYLDTGSSSQTYPAEIPAETEGEKVYVNSKEEAIEKFGKETTVYISDTNHKFVLSNPNA